MTNQVFSFYGGSQDIVELLGLLRPYNRWLMIGKSNVGKSTLINLLTESKRAHVSKTPGKTRSINFFLWESGKIYFVDCPGFGYAKRSKSERDSWKILVDEYIKKDPQLEGIVFLIDSRRCLSAEDLNAIQYLSKSRHSHIVVFTKSDKLKNQRELHQSLIKAKQQMQGIESAIKEYFFVSAKDSRGLALLRNRIGRKERSEV